jgi:hypothetical protein
MYNGHLEIGGQRRLPRAIARGLQFGLSAFGSLKEYIASHRRLKNYFDEFSR